MKKSLFKNTIVIGIGTVCTKILSLLMLPFYTYWLTPLEYGQYDLLISYLSLILPFITLQLEQAVLKWCLTKKNDNKKILYNGLMVSVINIFIINLIGFIFLYKENFFVPLMLYFDSYAIFVFLSEYLRGNNKLKLYSIYNILASILTVILSIILVYLFNFGMVGLLYSFGVAYVLVVILIITKEKLLYEFKFNKLDKKMIKEMITYSLPLIPNAISWWITNASDRTMIKLMIGNFYNGLYAISCKIPTIISIVYGIFNLSWQQEAITTYNDLNRNNYYNEIFEKLISVLFCSANIIITILPIFFNYLISLEYRSSLYITPYLIIGTVFLSLAQFIGGILLAEDLTKKIGYTTIMAAIINIIINSLFMKKYGLIVASISTMIAYIYFFISRYMLVKIIHSKKYIYKIIGYMFLSIIVSIISLMYGNLIINFILFLLLCVFSFFVNKILIIDIINKLFYKYNLK